jgi:hypothetical protein
MDRQYGPPSSCLRSLAAASCDKNLCPYRNSFIFGKRSYHFDSSLKSTEDISALQQVTDGPHHITSGVHMQQSQAKEVGVILCDLYVSMWNCVEPWEALPWVVPVLLQLVGIWERQILPFSQLSFQLHFVRVCYIQGNDSGQKCVTQTDSKWFYIWISDKECGSFML